MAIMKPGATSIGDNRLMLNVHEAMAALNCSRDCVIGLIKTGRLRATSATIGSKTELQITRASISLITPADIPKINHRLR